MNLPFMFSKLNDDVSRTVWVLPEQSVKILARYVFEIDD